MGRLVDILGVVALVLAGAFAFAVLAVAPRDAEFGYDSTAYLAAAERLRDGLPLYPDVRQGGGIDRGDLLDDEFGSFFYPPLVAVAFVPLSLVPDDIAILVWYATLAAIAAAVGIALVRRVPSNARPLAAAAYVSYLPLLSELRFGNVNLLTLAVVLLAWAYRDRAAVGGPLLAIGIGLKLLPLTLLAFLLVAGRIRLVAAAVTTGAIAVAATWPWLGGAWVDWLATLRALGLETPAAGSNIVPAGLATAPGRYFLPATALAVALVTGYLARRARKVEDDAFRVALAAAPLLVTSVWYPYLVLALPALLAPPRFGEHPGDLLARAVAWTTIQARAAPLPLLGLVVLLVAGLATTGGWLRGTSVQRRPAGRQPEAT